ncbi:MAG: McrB family protein [Lachnospirales bacterium]|jgi:5-methylcytosine-specific restriction protein B
MLLKSKNIILHGAPGTGKTYLARKIATDIITNGEFDDYTRLNDEQKKQIEFVQFHPSYDYSDFVEGLCPKINDDGSIGFELRDGIFMEFVERARKNYENTKKTKDDIKKEIMAQELMEKFFSAIDFESTSFKIKTGNEFKITDIDDNKIYIYIPNNPSIKNITIDVEKVKRMLESGKEFKQIKDVTQFFNDKVQTQQHSYYFAIVKEIKERWEKEEKSRKLNKDINIEKLKKFIFIIDEINRGEISKIFGELFFAIDPGYRGKAGEVSTQYANLHLNPNDKFYIPDNVYIIGTMNDIDRSVDSFDFAMRRRFRFVEVKANEHIEMLNSLKNEKIKKKAIERMESLNNAIVEVDGLNTNYQIGAAYFLKLNELTFEQLWTDCLKPLLEDYIQGMYDEEDIMEKLAEAYGYNELRKGNINEDTKG